jgi:hypothetical protein
MFSIGVMIAWYNDRIWAGHLGIEIPGRGNSHIEHTQIMLLVT